MKNYYGCWLHLSAEDNNILNPIIKRFSEEFDKGEVFPPHISLNFADKLPLHKVKNAVNNCIVGIKKFEVEKEWIQFTDRWSKTLFIQLKEDPKLSKISKFLGKTFDKNNKYVLDPHISLMYNDKINAETKKRLSESVVIPDRFIVSKIAVVTPGPENSWRDYGSWEIVYEKELE